MVKDDLEVIRQFIYTNGLIETFRQQSSTSDECVTNLNNIEIACDLTSDECLTWSLYNSTK
jgi:hypothetical protein